MFVSRPFARIEASLESLLCQIFRLFALSRSSFLASQPTTLERPISASTLFFFVSCSFIRS